MSKHCAKTALNHLLKIDDAKKELANTVRKTISREVQNLCNDKDSVFRGSNIKNFSWKSAHKELQKNCPVTIDLMKIICGNNKTEKLTPRLISSVGIMLFNRNQQMNAIQSINSVLMFRGHVRTRVSYIYDTLLHVHYHDWVNDIHFFVPVTFCKFLMRYNVLKTFKSENYVNRQQSPNVLS